MAAALPRPLAAGGSDARTLFVKVIEDFVAKGFGARGAIAVSRHGRLAVVHGAAMAPGERQVLASCSKAVTGLAIARLITQGRLRLDAPLSEVLADVIAANGPPADPRLLAVTVDQLHRHTGGLATNDRGDPTNGAQIRDLVARYVVERNIPRRALVAHLLRFPLARSPGESYLYSNADYLLLAQIVEEVSGQPYEVFCKTEVLTPAGVPGAAVDPNWAWRDGVGGWRMNTPEYLAFARLFDSRPPTVFGPAVTAALRATGGPYVDAPRKTVYAFGMNQRPGQKGETVRWHNGNHPGAQGHQCVYVHSDLGIDWMMWGSPANVANPPWDTQAWAAARAATSWPDADLFAEYLKA